MTTSPVSRSHCNVCALALQCPLGLSNEFWVSAVRERVRMATYPADHVFLEGRDGSDRFSFIKTGHVLVRQMGPDGVYRPVALIGQGFLMGAFGFSGYAPKLDAETVGKVSVCELAYADLVSLKPTDASVDRALRRFREHAAQVMISWSHLMRIRSAPQRLAAALNLMRMTHHASRLTLPPHHVLADLLAISRETVSRALDELVAARLVRRISRGVVDVDEAALRAWLQRLC